MIIDDFPYPAEDPVNIRRREFEALRREVAEMKAQTTQDEFSHDNRIYLVRKIARALGVSLEEVCKGG